MPSSSPPRSATAGASTETTTQLVLPAGSVVPSPPKIAAPFPAPVLTEAAEAAAPPAPEGSAPRPGADAAPSTPEKGLSSAIQAGDGVPEAPSSPAPVPAGFAAKGFSNANTGGVVEAVIVKEKEAVLLDEVTSSKAEFSSPSKKEFVSPNRHRTPVPKSE